MNTPYSLDAHVTYFDAPSSAQQTRRCRSLLPASRLPPECARTHRLLAGPFEQDNLLFLSGLLPSAGYEDKVSRSVFTRAARPNGFRMKPHTCGMLMVALAISSL